MWKRLIGSYVTDVRLLSDRIVAISDRHVYLMDLDGTVRMSLNISGRIRESAILDDRIIVGMDDDKVYCYNLSGRIMWDMSTAGRITDISAKKQITIGTERGRAIRIGLDGTQISVLNASSVISQVLEPDAGIIIATLDDRISIYNKEGMLKRFYEVEGRTTVLTSAGYDIFSATSSGQVYFTRVPVSEGSTSSFILGFSAFILIASCYMVINTWRS